MGFAAVRRKPVPGNHALAGQSGAFTARAGFEGETAQDSRPARPFSMPARVPVSAPTPVAATLPSRKPVPARVSLLPQRGEPGLPPPAPVHASATVLDSARPRPLHHNPPHSPQHSSLLTGWSAHRRATLYSPLLLTLIRRDPGSGAQWNVAETRDVLASESTSLDGYSGAAWVGRHSGIAETTASPGEPAIQIDMLTSGYARFHSFDATVAADRQWGEAGMRPPTGPQHSQSAPLLHFPSPTATSLPQSPHAAQGDATVFRRRMRVDSAVSDGSGAGSRRGRGYAFECPWGGRCEFSTGATGRVLKVCPCCSLAPLSLLLCAARPLYHALDTGPSRPSFSPLTSSSVPARSSHDSDHADRSAQDTSRPPPQPAATPTTGQRAALRPPHSPLPARLPLDPLRCRGPDPLSSAATTPPWSPHNGGDDDDGDGRGNRLARSRPRSRARGRRFRRQARQAGQASRARRRLAHARSRRCRQCCALVAGL